MSLKAIHICFILLAITLAVGTGYWALREGRLYFAIGSFAVGAGLLVYLFWFLVKMKKVFRDGSPGTDCR